MDCYQVRLLCILGLIYMQKDFLTLNIVLKANSVNITVLEILPITEIAVLDLWY